MPGSATEVEVRFHIRKWQPLLARNWNTSDCVASVGMAAKISEVFFVFRRALAHTTLQTLLQQGSRSRSFELLALRTTLGAALCVSLELKAANVRLRRRASNVIPSKALLAA